MMIIINSTYNKNYYVNSNSVQLRKKFDK